MGVDHGPDPLVASAVATYTPDLAMTYAVGTAITETFTTLNVRQF